KNISQNSRRTTLARMRIKIHKVARDRIERHAALIEAGVNPGRAIISGPDAAIAIRTKPGKRTQCKIVLCLRGQGCCRDAERRQPQGQSGSYFHRFVLGWRLRKSRRGARKSKSRRERKTQEAHHGGKSIS